MKVNEKIESRRKELNLSDVQVAQRSDLSIDEYCDIEWHEDEIFTVTDLREIKKLCSTLKLDFLELFEVRCRFCDDMQPYLEAYYLPRNNQIAKRRQELNISQDELGDKIGFETIA